MTECMLGTFITHAEGSCEGLFYRCLSVCLFFCTISKNDAARINKPHIVMLCDVSWKPIYSVLKRSKS